MSEMRDTSDGSLVADSSTPDTVDTLDTDDQDLRLDGNAAAGILAEIFTHEMTSAQSACAQCGRAGPLGSLILYGGQMGTILRCPTCGSVQMRVVYVPERGGQYWMDMRGMASMRIAPSSTAAES
jgi:hypothetical protein